MFAHGRDPAFEVAVKAAMDNQSITAGASADGVAINGQTIDLLETGNLQRYNGAGFLVQAKATLAATETLTVSVKLEQSADDSTWTELKAAETVLTLTGGSGGSTERGVGKISGDLALGDRYVRAVITPTLSASGTDTAELSAVAMLTPEQLS